MTADRRIAARKNVDLIHINELTSLSSYSVIAHTGIIVDASQSGMLLSVERSQLVPKEYKENLTMANLIGHHVAMFLPQMNLDLDGTITRADHVGKGRFEIAITFSDDVPEYWRASLVDLLPAPGEITEDEPKS